VPVAHRIAHALRAELDVLVVRKLGHPNNPELAMGALAWGGVCVLNRGIISGSALDEANLAEVIETETRELLRRERAYRGSRPMPAVRGRSVLIVDDGIATGATILAAAEAVRRLSPQEIVLVAPVAPRDGINRLERAADRVIVAHVAAEFRAVGDFYQSFEPVSDAEVRRYLEDAWRPPRRRSGVVPAFGARAEKDVRGASDRRSRRGS
jgi:putative phosphoribosyl transferase